MFLGIIPMGLCAPWDNNIFYLLLLQTNIWNWFPNICNILTQWYLISLSTSLSGRTKEVTIITTDENWYDNKIPLQNDATNSSDIHVFAMGQPNGPSWPSDQLLL